MNIKLIMPEGNKQIIQDDKDSVPTSGSTIYVDDKIYHVKERYQYFDTATSSRGYALELEPSKENLTSLDTILDLLKKNNTNKFDIDMLFNNYCEEQNLPFIDIYICDDGISFNPAKLTSVEYDEEGCDISYRLGKGFIFEPARDLDCSQAKFLNPSIVIPFK